MPKNGSGTDIKSPRAAEPGGGTLGHGAHPLFRKQENVPFFQTKVPFLDHEMCSILDKDVR